MNYQNAEDLQSSFDSACALVYEAFPKQISGDWMSDQFGTCGLYISHGARLSRHFKNYHIPGQKNSLSGSQKFIDLMANCGRYLMEIGDYETSLRLVQSGQIACGDNINTLSYAKLCMVAGADYYEQNKITECRKNYEIFHRIQEKLLHENDLEQRANTLHSIHYAYGNIEYEKKNWHAALLAYKTCLKIALAKTPIHPITASAYYSLGCVEFELKHNDVAV
ncbi:unnamed protein product, partial [Sphagnum balticum]